MLAAMMKHIRTIGIAAAALAASAVLVSTPAIAQQGREQELAGAPGSQQQTPELFRDQNRDWDRDWNSDRDWDRDRDWNRNDDRRRAPDFQRAQEQCSRAAIQEAWRRDFYSAQYDGRPRLEYGRYGWELRGRIRLHDRRGYHYVNTACDLRGRNSANIEFLR
jgi:hypothetical protein